MALLLLQPVTGCSAIGPLGVPEHRLAEMTAKNWGKIHFLLQCNNYRRVLMYWIFYIDLLSPSTLNPKGIENK
jgi:hypothetical protein